MPPRSLYEVSHTSSDSRKITCATPSLAYIFAGSGVVLENSSVTCPSHSGSRGVTLTMIPQRAYVDLPRQMVSTLRGMRKYSTERASAKEFGGMMHTSALMSTKLLASKLLGSTTAELILVFFLFLLVLWLLLLFLVVLLVLLC